MDDLAIKFCKPVNNLNTIAYIPTRLKKLNDHTKNSMCENTNV